MDFNLNLNLNCDFALKFNYAPKFNYSLKRVCKIVCHRLLTVLNPFLLLCNDYFFIIILEANNISKLKQICYKSYILIFMSKVFLFIKDKFIKIYRCYLSD